jgi:hypothetical protein
MLLLALGVVCAAMVPRAAHAQASAIPSAQAPSDTTSGSQGRKLLDQMVAALGGPAWLDRQDWIFYGRAATFYKGQPHEEAPQIEEYYRAQPFAERVVIITYSGVIISTNHRDVAEVWTPDNGFEITFKGTKPLPAKDVADYERRHSHSLDVVVNDWLKQPGTIVSDEGTTMVERHLAETVSVVTAKDDAVTLELDEDSHLPLSISFQWHDPLYNDLNTDVQQFADYHSVQGIMTPFSVTLLHNGDMSGQRFLTKVVYNANLPPDLFDPSRPLSKKTKVK